MINDLPLGDQKVEAIHEVEMYIWAYVPKASMVAKAVQVPTAVVLVQQFFLDKARWEWETSSFLYGANADFFTAVLLLPRCVSMRCWWRQWHRGMENFFEHSKLNVREHSSCPLTLRSQEIC